MKLKGSHPGGIVGIKRRYHAKERILFSKPKFNNYVGKDSDVSPQSDQGLGFSVQELTSHSTIQQQILSWLLASHWLHWALSLVQGRFTLHCKVQSWGKKDKKTFTIPSKFNLEINRWSTCCLVKGRQELTQSHTNPVLQLMLQFKEYFQWKYSISRYMHAILSFTNPTSMHAFISF